MQFTRFPFIYATQTKLQLKLFELRLIVASNRLTRRERDSPTIYLLAVIRIMQNTIDATTFLKTKLRDRTAYEGTFFFPPPAKRYDTTLYNTSIEIIKFRYVRILRSQINSHLFSSHKNTTRAFLLKKKKGKIDDGTTRRKFGQAILYISISYVRKRKRGEGRKEVGSRGMEIS